MPQHITIPRGTIELAADLHLPDVIDEAAPPRAVVLSTPGAPNPVDLMVIEGAGHYEMYDEPDYVDAAVDRLVDFYSDHL
jgi:pimeloyl-ACP methyl ester carboxylesterase